MRASTKVVINTIFLYARLLISMAISLISVRLVLRALGASDYGIYNLVAGVVSMLSFLTNSMTVSSQRYLSVTMGMNDNERFKGVFNMSFFIHLLLGIIVVVVFEIGSFFVPNLNIPTERLGVAMILYQLLIVDTFLNILRVPFDGLINAHEDLLVFSVTGIITSLLKLVAAICLSIVSFDKLLFYGIAIVLISICSFSIVFFWTKHSYKNLKLKFSFFIDKLLFKEMTCFAGWNLFGGIAMVGRNQGVAVIINFFLGTIANAAYGIANQVNGALSEFSAVLPKALNPQLMKSEGMNDRGRLIRISIISSKVSVLAFCLFAVPLILEMHEIFKIWLGGDIPPFTERLSQCILIFTIISQYSNGLMSAIQATGKIRNYQIIMSFIIVTNIPLAYIILKLGCPIYYVTATFVIIEFLSLIIRILMGKRIVGIKIQDFLRGVIMPTLIIVVGSVIFAIIPRMLLRESIFRLIIVCLVYLFSFIAFSWLFIFEDSNQRNAVVSDIRKLIGQRFSIKSKL